MGGLETTARQRAWHMCMCVRNVAVKHVLLARAVLRCAAALLSLILTHSFTHSFIHSLTCLLGCEPRRLRVRAWWPRSWYIGVATQPIRSCSGGVSRVFHIPGPTPNLV